MNRVVIFCAAIWWGGGVFLACRVGYFRWKMLHHFAPGVEAWKAFDSRQRFSDAELFTPAGLAYRDRAARGAWHFFYWAFGVGVLMSIFVPKH